VEMFDGGVFIGVCVALGVGAANGCTPAAIEGMEAFASTCVGDVAAALGAGGGTGTTGRSVASGGTDPGVGAGVVGGTGAVRGAVGVSMMTAGRPDEKVLVKSLCSLAFPGLNSG